MLSFYLSENGVIYYRRTREEASNILSVLRNLGTTEQMRSELESMGLSFGYPKPKQLLEYVLQVGTGTATCLILDSFAGSGTTGHAVLQMNKADGGKRQFICIEMDETIACDVTAQRLKKVIEGYNGRAGGRAQMPCQVWAAASVSANSVKPCSMKRATSPRKSLLPI